MGGKKASRDRSPANKSQPSPDGVGDGDDLELIKENMTQELARLREQYMENERERAKLREQWTEVRGLKDSISGQLDAVMHEREMVEASRPPPAVAESESTSNEPAGLQDAILLGARPAPAVPAPAVKEAGAPAAPDARGKPGPEHPAETPREDAVHGEPAAAAGDETIVETGTGAGPGPVEQGPEAGPEPAGEDGFAPYPEDEPRGAFPAVSEAEAYSFRFSEEAGPRPGGATSEELDSLARDLGDRMDVIREELDRLGSRLRGIPSQSDVARSLKSVSRLEAKVTGLEEEVGLGEVLNVGKMPPHIIEIVYQATLDDVIRNLFRELGPYDTERHVKAVLEDIHRQTSGSELFFFDGAKLRTRNLANVIERKLISAKQVHMTYERLLDRLKEVLPDYKPKNFRAMIRLKSQEYTIDRVLTIMDSLDTLKGQIDSVRSSLLDRMGEVEDGRDAMVGELERLRERFGSMEEDVSQARKRAEESAASVESLESRIAGDGSREEDGSRLDALDTQVRDMAGSLEKAMDEVASVSAIFSSRLTRTEAKLEVTGKGLDDISARLAALEQGMSEALESLRSGAAVAPAARAIPLEGTGDGDDSTGEGGGGDGDPGGDGAGNGDEGSSR